jgi:hypothetical protein
MEMRIIDRVAAAFVLALMAIGTLVLWIGVPAGCLWAASKLVDSVAGHFVVGLPMIIVGMSVWGALLFWLNGLYLRILGFYAEPDDPDEPPRRIRGPLEPMLVISLVIGFVAFLFWFFVFAENPSVSIY